MARILIIDDYRPVLVVLRELLAREGHTVFLALGGEAGLERAATTRVDLALVDADMPGLDGFMVCRALRALRAPAPPPPPVLMMTGRLPEEAGLRGVAAGAFGLIEKPFDHTVLLQEIARGLALGEVR